MNKLWLWLGAITFAFLISYNVNAAGGAACGSYLSEDGLTKGVCDTAYVDASDKASLQRGAQIYMNYCLGCHSLKYARYKKVSEDLEIPLDMFEENLIFGDQKIGDLIQVGIRVLQVRHLFFELLKMLNKVQKRSIELCKL